MNDCKNEVKTYKRVVAELIPKYNKKNQLPSVKVDSSATASEFIRKFYPVDLNYREAFVALYLNRANNVQGFTIISTGGLSGTVADPKLIFQNALLCNASSLIVSHNHPSGNVKPSHADINVTKKIKEVGTALNLPLIDHVILTENDLFSFADEGLL